MPSVMDAVVGGLTGVARYAPVRRQRELDTYEHNETRRKEQEQKQNNQFQARLTQAMMTKDDGQVDAIIKEWADTGLMGEKASQSAYAYTKEQEQKQNNQFQARLTQAMMTKDDGQVDAIIKEWADTGLMGEKASQSAYAYTQRNVLDPAQKATISDRNRRMGQNVEFDDEGGYSRSPVERTPEQIQVDDVNRRYKESLTTANEALARSRTPAEGEIQRKWLGVFGDKLDKRTYELEKRHKTKDEYSGEMVWEPGWDEDRADVEAKAFVLQYYPPPVSQTPREVRSLAGRLEEAEGEPLILKSGGGRSLSRTLAALDQTRNEAGVGWDPERNQMMVRALPPQDGQGNVVEGRRGMASADSTGIDSLGSVPAAGAGSAIADPEMQRQFDAAIAELVKGGLTPEQAREKLLNSPKNRALLGLP